MEIKLKKSEKKFDMEWHPTPEGKSIPPEEPVCCTEIAPNFREIPKQSCYECAHFSPRTLSPDVCLKHPVVYQNIQPTTVTCDDWLYGTDISVNMLEKINDCTKCRDDQISALEKKWKICLR